MRVLLASLFALALASGVSAADDPCFPPKPADQTHRLFQYVEFLDAGEQRALDEKLIRFSAETSNQIVVVVVGDLCDYEPVMFAQRILEEWGIGKKNKDNGVVVLVKPTGNAGQRKIFITTGYGLEGAIPDATCKQIVEDEIIPAFKQGRFAEGLDRGTNTLMALAKGEVNASDYHRRGDNMPWWSFLIIAFFIVVVMLVKRAQVSGYAHRNRIGFWQAWWLMNAASRSHGGRWGGFSGGGGGGWSGGGFGGGSGGGGGAGGSW